MLKSLPCLFFMQYKKYFGLYRIGPSASCDTTRTINIFSHYLNKQGITNYSICIGCNKGIKYIFQFHTFIKCKTVHHSTEYNVLYSWGVLQKNWVQMCSSKFWLPPDSKTTDEPIGNQNLRTIQPIFATDPLKVKIKKAPNIKPTFFKNKRGDRKTWGAKKATYRSQLHVRIPTFPLSTPQLLSTVHLCTWGVYGELQNCVNPSDNLEPSPLQPSSFWKVWLNPSSYTETPLWNGCMSY